MSFLSPATFVATNTAGHGQGGNRERAGTNGSSRDAQLRSRNSIAAIVGLVKDPVGSLTNAVDSWYEKDAHHRAQVSANQVLESKKRILYLKLHEATSYDVWRETAEELDELEDNNSWKATDESPDYDSELVAARLRQLDEAREAKDVARMVFLIRTALTRDLGRMGNVELYKHSHVGTKDLIERYINSTLETLQVILELSSRLPEKGPNSHRNILEQVILARQSFGRSALLLSGGGTFGMSHNGVLKTLWENGLLPRIISGASAGSIVSAIMCTRTDEEIPELLDQFCHGDLAVFEEEGNEEGYVRKLARFLKHGHLYDISHLTRVMRQSLGDMTFQEGYNRTRRILNICVSSASLYDLPRLLNYVTAPNVVIWSAVAASCSVPLIFSPASLLAKDLRTGELFPWDPTPQRWIDGSVDNDLPMTRLAEMFNVNHFIVSQVNPHVVPFLSREEGLATSSDDTSLLSPGTLAPATSSWLYTATHLAKGEALYRLRSMAEMGIFPNALTKAAAILNQKYSGDITILPTIALQDFPLILKNPTEEFMVKSALMGERATWPKLSRVRNHCAIELALDDAVQRLRTRVVFSASQVDLRQDAYTRAKSAAKKKHHKHGRDNSHGNKSMLLGRSATKTKRSMSQNSEPDASLMMATRGIRPSNRPGSSASGNSGRSAYSERKPHSIQLPASSVTTLASTLNDGGVASLDSPAIGTASRPRYGRPVSFQVPPSATSNSPVTSRRMPLPSGGHEMISSGAETSGIYSTDDEDNGMESDGSATSTGSPPRVMSPEQYSASDWPVKDSEQNWFPHASQPPTPMVSQGFRPFGFTFTPASPPDASETEGASHEKKSSSKGKKNQTSDSETKHRQFFHGSKASRQSSSSKNENSAASSRSNSEGRGMTKKISALGLEIPLPSRKRGGRDAA